MIRAAVVCPAMDRRALPLLTTEELIRVAVGKFCARRGTQTVFAGGRRVEVHLPGERVLHLPNGAKVRVSVDDSGVATQVEEDHSLHAIARPRPINPRVLVQGGQ